ncbi:unnamed protein product [Closterium sp. Naga37s-1]|nr:unnamed protein product [Closterium sp. Naga37s-1]CAI5496636.1 unnamed protein product [Closterium sp. Naga37s-1]CAI5498170.1 unnamed protein product [Closterium sp. Naga37s-1]CAI5509139.1 unnamed protein product [Closterium sp. Naga37s-1]CAI5524163.1 unnamed protein product [Closterium sp. Naga37s-1]
MHKSFCHTSLSLHIPVLTPPFPPTAICASRHNTHPSLSPFPLSLSSLPFTLSPSLSPLPSLPFLSPLHPLPFPLSPSLSPFPLSPSPSPFPSLPFLSLLPSLHHPYPLLLSPFPLFTTFLFLHISTALFLIPGAFLPPVTSPFVPVTSRTKLVPGEPGGTEGTGKQQMHGQMHEGEIGARGEMYPVSSRYCTSVYIQ